MDFFRFDPSSATYFTNAKPFPENVDVMWVERYREPGEFKFVAPLSSGLEDFLPTGCFVCHKDSYEPMMVEDHFINEEVDSDPVITITGRSYDAILEERLFGLHQIWGSQPDTIPELSLVADYSWNQANNMVRKIVQQGQGYDQTDILDNLIVWYDITPGRTGVAETRVMQRGSLHARLLELLEIDDLGIRVIRRSTATRDRIAQPYTYFIIHDGKDKSTSVIFSSENGDFQDTDSLWSRRKLKNAALVTGRYVETRVLGSEMFYDRRYMYIDASDIDGSLDTAPTGTAVTDIRNKMIVRGKQKLNAQKTLRITRTAISTESKYQYRKDYDIGDLVTIEGRDGNSTKMRVTEHVEIEDETGFTSYPTLSVVE